MRAAVNYLPQLWQAYYLLAWCCSGSIVGHLHFLPLLLPNLFSLFCLFLVSQQCQAIKIVRFDQRQKLRIPSISEPKVRHCPPAYCHTTRNTRWDTTRNTRYPQTRSSGINYRITRNTAATIRLMEIYAPTVRIIRDDFSLLAWWRAWYWESDSLYWFTALGGSMRLSLHVSTVYLVLVISSIKSSHDIELLT